MKLFVCVLRPAARSRSHGTQTENFFIFFSFPVLLHIDHRVIVMDVLGSPGIWHHVYSTGKATELDRPSARGCCANWPPQSRSSSNDRETSWLTWLATNSCDSQLELLLRREVEVVCPTLWVCVCVRVCARLSCCPCVSVCMQHASLHSMQQFVLGTVKLSLTLLCLPQLLLRHRNGSRMWEACWDPRACQPSSVFSIRSRCPGIHAFPRPGIFRSGQLASALTLWSLLYG